jgi:hypothetical protein
VCQQVLISVVLMSAIFIIYLLVFFADIVLAFVYSMNHYLVIELALSCNFLDSEKPKGRRRHISHLLLLSKFKQQRKIPQKEHIIMKLSSTIPIVYMYTFLLNKKKRRRR